MLWPAMDNACSRVIFDMAKDLDHVWPFVTDYRACVQAGGNCGLWPQLLAARFGHVYTAEPHPDNFTALAFNTAHLRNVIRMQAAFGEHRELIQLELAPHEVANCGAYYVKSGGFVPTLRIDDLGVAPGLIYLDIEGMELVALQGAHRTITEARPVIVIEDKGLSEKYGTVQGDAEKYLANVHRYAVAKRVHRDVILVPSPR